MRDFQLAFRQFVKHPGFAIVAILTLALGIGANTAIFTVINAAMLRMLPVQDPRELVQLTISGGTWRDFSFSFPGYERLRDNNKSLTGLFAASGVADGTMIASSFGGKAPELIRQQPVTGNFFSVLGVQSELGRLIGAEDDQRGKPEAAVILSYAFWERRFGADRSIIGKTISLNELPVTIVGVARRGFFGFQPGENPDIWFPLQLWATMSPQGGAMQFGEGSTWLRLIGRVQPGTSFRQAQSELAVVYEQYRSDRDRGSKKSAADQNRIEKLELQLAGAGWNQLRIEFRQPLLILSAIVGLVLLIACANVASLLLARAVSRSREFSIRAALGAKRIQLIRQLLAESVLLSAIGGGLGLLFAQWGANLLVSYSGVRTNPLSLRMDLDARVLGFTFGLSVLTGVLFGLLPALRASRIDPGNVIKASGGGIVGTGPRQRLQQSLVVLQVALTLVLLVGAALFVQTLRSLKGMDMGFSRENVLLLQVAMPPRIEPVRKAIMSKEIIERLQRTPGVNVASASALIPLGGNYWGQQFNPEGYAASPGETVRGNGMLIAPRFFETMDSLLLSGRDFGPLDESLDTAVTNKPATVIINEALAKRYFGDGSPLGRHLSFLNAPNRRYEVIGVVRDAKYRSLRDPAPPTFYLSCFQESRPWNLVFAVRATGQPESIIESLRAAVRQVDSTLVIRHTQTMEETVNASIRDERVIASLGGFFSLAALGLACLGLYGTLSFSVAQRVREIGVRMALGARQGDVLSLVVANGLKLTLLGCLLGLTGALATTRLVSKLLYGVTPNDPATFVGTAIALLLVATFASWLPARRAANVDPMQALRQD